MQQHAPPGERQGLGRHARRQDGVRQENRENGDDGKSRAGENAGDSEYGGSRGTITYNADGTTSFNEPGLRKGSGKWQLRDGEICQSFSGIKEPCVSLRQSGKAIYLGSMKLTKAE